MKFITSQEAVKWCRDHGFGLNDRSLPALRDIPGASQFAIPRDAGERTALVRRHLNSLDIKDSCLVWLDDWDVWPSGQWHHLFKRFRLSYGCEASLSDRPAHIVDKGDLDTAVSMAVYSVLMLWDCYVITDSGSWIYYSHDELGYLKA